MQLKDAQLFRQQAYIDGQWLDADSGQTIAVNNPATGEILSQWHSYSRPTESLTSTPNNHEH